MSDEVQVIEEPEASSSAVPVDPIAEPVEPIAGPSDEKPKAPQLTPEKEKAKRRWNLASEKVYQSKKARVDGDPPNRDNIPIPESTYGLYSLTRLDDPENDDRAQWMTLKWNAARMSIEERIMYNGNTRSLPDIIVRMLSSNNLSADVLQGFDNTGNVRIWPSGEALAWRILTGYGDRFKKKKVLELGCGMTALASICASYFAELVIATDGSEIAVENARKCIAKNGRNNVKAVVHKWGDEVSIPEMYNFHYVIAGDCLFDLANLEKFGKSVNKHMNNTGSALIVSPERSGALGRFIDVIKDQYKLVVNQEDLTPSAKLEDLRTKLGEAFDVNLDVKLVYARRPDK